MNIIIDENLPPSWRRFLEGHGYSAKHWLDAGRMGDSDEVVWNHALANLSVILSQDLDFSRMLALRGTELPSVIQLRVDAPIPEVCGADVLAVLRRYEAQLVEGCLISLQKDRHKVRLLPFR